MGRGSSKAGGGGKTMSMLTLPSGETIDLTESPLTYGEKDSMVSGKVRDVLESFENNRHLAKVEYNRLIDSEGNIIEENKGGKGSVGASNRARLAADIVTHNHPGDPEGLGGTFSDKDLSNMVEFGQTTYRATAKEGTYSISKGKGFQGDNLVKAYKVQQAKTFDAAQKAHDSLHNDYAWSKISYTEYQSGVWKINNKMLVEDHNWLLANQKTYGYTYTLEGR
ncbi:MAG: hypothetical protein J6Z02_01935 [Lachnospiraceae bacterium]|nr:hypothetical protein [Lachnospiraceae bacterium]